VDGTRDGSMGAAEVGGDGTTTDASVAYVVLDVVSDAPLTSVSSFRVKVVAADGTTRTLAFAQSPPANLDPVTVTRLTVPLVESEIGPSGFEVDAFDLVGCRVATGSAAAVARAGASIHVAVRIHLTETCVSKDGGATDGGGPDAARDRNEGEDCAWTGDCVSELVCVAVGADRKCRAACRCDAQASTCTAASDCSTPGTQCRPLAGNAVDGVCLP
jgi:hypothetical protein